MAEIIHFISNFNCEMIMKNMASNKAITKKAISKVKTNMSIAMWFYCCLWFDNNAPIASLIRSFMSQNSHSPKILDVFLYSAFSYTNLVSHVIGCD